MYNCDKEIIGAPLAEKVETEVGKPEKTMSVQLIIKYILILMVSLEWVVVGWR